MPGIVPGNQPSSSLPMPNRLNRHRSLARDTWQACRGVGWGAPSLVLKTRSATSVRGFSKLGYDRPASAIIQELLHLLPGWDARPSPYAHAGQGCGGTGKNQC